MTDTETRERGSITVSRVIKAPPERVYEAFLDPDQLAAWLPPTGFSATVHHQNPKKEGRSVLRSRERQRNSPRTTTPSGDVPRTRARRAHRPH
ncbi:SRPBCC family protein [Haladaptatus sp. GCM10025707]|uniref:SRPBCC family protein n=1 Tax=Haladaptatus sp. GCM10025707 TaxID=3252658 RepID=UPI00361E3049